MDVRPATSSDVSDAVILIHATASGFLDSLFGFGKRERALKALTHFYLDPKSRFSFTRGRVCEINGHVAGLLISFAGEDNLKLDLSLGRLILKEYGLRRSLVFLRNVFYMPYIQEAKRGEWYIAHLATSASYRRKGVGRFLLEDAFHHAQENGKKRCSLVVDIDNIEAISLYQHAGFKIVKTIKTSQQESFMHSGGQHRMIRDF